METDFDEQIRNVTMYLAQALNPERIILFGSHAYGQPAADSDVDLLIVMDSAERPAARAARVSRLLRPRPFPVDILVRTPQEIEHRLDIGDDFVRQILECGKVLYDRDISGGVDTQS
jgi:predicted nucleotidyltransferase